MDLFMEGIDVMADAETITKIKKSLLNPASVCTVHDDINDLGMMDQMNGF